MKVVDMAKYCFVVLVAMFVFGLWNSAVQSAPVQETRKICTQREFNRIVLQLCRDYDTDIDKRGQSRGGSEDWSSEKDEEFQEESLKLWISPNEEGNLEVIKITFSIFNANYQMININCLVKY